METKRCSKCKKMKPLNEFYENTSIDGRYSSCKQCKRKSKRQYYAKHREEMNKRTAQYRIDNPIYDVQHRIKYRAKHRKEINRHAAQWRADNPDYHRQYRIDNTGKYRAYNANRYALSIAAEGTFTDEQFVELCNKYGNRCLRCGKVTELTVDHIIPLSKGGSNDMENIQCLCKRCNSKKHTQTTDYRPDMVEQIPEGKDKD